MGSNRIAQPVWRYLVAVGVSAIALAIIAILQPVVGFLELLYLFAVAFIDTYAGEGPAVLTIVLWLRVTAIGRRSGEPEYRYHRQARQRKR